ncbi:type VII secretion target [Mycolicibacterium diernhoferi]|uniref:ESX-1 secretion-associated protein n=3 Tax=Mycolicibacterium diernhoferi TaxID=1801 RepID=A0A2A7NZ35_9MYCO|nr:type VII secretion target [Mycolicibacterium diernhoferi]PEG55490.1 ESX-1 secretion-associated protein [Mycolicibacterium diernhoferi]
MHRHILKEQRYGEGMGMSQASMPLKVDPTELQLAADQLEGQAGSFTSAHRSSHEKAGHASLGASASTAALPAMLASWDDDCARYSERFATLAGHHRVAAAKYSATDDRGADDIDAAGSAL